jgi:hypothetical protein
VIEIITAAAVSTMGYGIINGMTVVISMEAFIFAISSVSVGLQDLLVLRIGLVCFSFFGWVLLCFLLLPLSRFVVGTGIFYAMFGVFGWLLLFISLWGLCLVLFACYCRLHSWGWVGCLGLPFRWKGI